MNLLHVFLGKGVVRPRSSSPVDPEVEVASRNTKRQRLTDNNPFLDLEADVAEDEEDDEDRDGELEEFIDDGV